MAPKKKQTQKGMKRTLEEELKIRPRWKAVLLAFYTDELVISKEWEWEENITKNNSSAKKLGLSEQELIHALFYLENNGLIESSHASPWTELTKKGFDVAFKIEGQRETRLYRLSSIFLTWVLALTLLITLLHQMNLVDPRLLLIAYIIALLVVLGIFRRKPKPTKK